MRCNKLRPESGVVVYRVEPETSPFDVTPLSGDVFSRYNILNGRYHFDIVATDSFGQVTGLAVNLFYLQISSSVWHLRNKIEG